MLMLNANYSDSFFDRLTCVSDYIPWKKLERKTSTNPETEKPCCLLAVYSFPAEKEWQAILKGQKFVRKKAEAVALSFPLMPILPGSKLLPEVTRLQPLVCFYKLCLFHLKYIHSCLITSVSLNSSVEMDKGDRFSKTFYGPVLWQNTEAVPAISWYSYIWHCVEEGEKGKFILKRKKKEIKKKEAREFSAPWIKSLFSEILSRKCCRVWKLRCLILFSVIPICMMQFSGQTSLTWASSRAGSGQCVLECCWTQRNKH